MEKFLKFSSKGNWPAFKYQSVLEKGQWFKLIPEDFKQALLEQAEIVMLKPDQYLFSRYDVFDGIYCLVEGTLHINNVNKEGKQVLLSIIQPNIWFGESALMHGQCRMCNAVAESACVVIYIPAKALYQMLEDTPARWRYIAWLITEKLCWAYAKIEETTLMSASERVVNRLIIMAEGCYAIKSAKKHLLKVSQEHLASMLVLSRQTTNQILKQLEARHIIKVYYREIEIINLEALKKLLH